MQPSRRIVIPTILILAGFVGGIVFGVGGQPPAEAAKANPDQEAVHKVLETLANGFNAGDAKAASAAFAPNAEYIDDDGNRADSRGAIEGFLTKFFAANKGAKLAITPDGARTVAPGIVLEDGESVVTVPDKGTQSIRQFAITYAKVDGAWKIVSMREFPEVGEDVSAAEKMKPLEWLIGDWMDEGEDSVLAISSKWSADKSFIVREFTVKHKGKDVLSGNQRIGVDPLTGLIRGWSIDSEGGYGESTWTPNGDHWLVRGTAVTADGEPAASTNLLKPLGKDRIEWKVVHKVIGETVEPDSTTTLVRKLAK